MAVPSDDKDPPEWPEDLKRMVSRHFGRTFLADVLLSSESDTDSSEKSGRPADAIAQMLT